MNVNKKYTYLPSLHACIDTSVLLENTLHALRNTWTVNIQNYTLDLGAYFQYLCSEDKS